MNTILTHSGQYFDLADPQPDMIRIEDIAHALSHICRFTGHTRHFYSVAEHSVLVSCCVPRELAMQGLLHDATEAYVNDIAAPLKLLLPDYRAIEARVWTAIAERFGLPLELDPLVKDADLSMLTAERRHLMPPTADRWPCEDSHPATHGLLPNGLLPVYAWQHFTTRFAVLEALEAA